MVGPPISYNYPYMVVYAPDSDPDAPFQATRYHKELYEAHDPLNYADAENGWPWYKFTGAIARMFDQVDAYARDQDDGTPGWGILMDPDRCPAEALPWLAQFVGVTLNGELTVPQQRQRIKSTDGFKRGSIGAMVGAAQQYLTGQQTVFFRERDAGVSGILGGAYGITMITYTSETPDSAKVLAAVMKQKPAGIILNYATVVGGTYLLDRTNYATYSALRAAFATYNGMRNNAPGT